jgi:hypothetical protein
MDQNVLRICYDIFAVMRYNGERNFICSEMFKKVLIEDKKQVTIESFTRELTQEYFYGRHKNDEKDTGFISSSEHFNFLDNSFVLNTRLDSIEVIEYLKKRYFVYNSLFQNVYPTSIEDIVQIASTLISMIIEKSRNLHCSFERYEFGKMEYGDLGFVKIPDRKYVSNWAKVTTFSKQDLIDHLPNKEVEINFFLNNYCFTQLQVQSEPDIRFQEYPIFKIEVDTYILAFPFLLIQCLPQKLEYFLQQIPDYQGLKGKTFENMALELFDNVLCKEFRQNFVYASQEGEIDGILEFKNNFWLIECKSRPPSLKSLRGDYKAIRADINKTVKKSEIQIDRALRNRNKLKIDPAASKNAGSIIVLDGIYPQLNTTTFFCIAPSKLKIPRLIINYFDLMEILSQPNSYLFEEFLKWRTQKNMPIMCHDEMDYWIFFSKYGFNLEVQKGLKNAVKRNNHIIYRGW